MKNTILQWHKTAWSQFVSRAQDNRLPHALLLMGEKGIGKSQFAVEMAAALLCNEFLKTGKRCYACQSCQLSDANTHPDLLKIESDSGHAIKVDQIRDVTTFVSQTSLLGRYQIVIIKSASSMNINAANALLKTLEEPASHVLLILISETVLNLPATILSRCQKIILHPPEIKHGQDWLHENIKESNVDLSLLLNLCHGAPLAALEYFKEGAYQFRQEFYQGLKKFLEGKSDPVELSQQWQEKNLKIILQLLLSWINDLLRIKVNAVSSVIVNQDHSADLKIMSQKMPLEFLLRYREFTQKIYKYICAGHNLNQRLAIEELLIKCK